VLKKRTQGEYESYLEGFRAGLKTAALRLETANDETSHICIIKALRELAELSVPLTAPTTE